MKSSKYVTRRVCLQMAAGLGTVGLVGCGDAGEPPLRIGTNIWTGYEPLYLARGRGYLDGDIAHLVEYTSASEVIRAFGGGQLECAAVTLDEALLLAERGQSIQIFLVTDISNGGDVIVGQSDMAGASDLKGRRIGVEDTALGAYFLARALEATGLGEADVQIVPLTVDEHERAFLERRVDAVVTFDPVRSKLVNAGARELFSSRELPNEIVDVLVARSDLLPDRLDHLKHVARAWFQALRYMETHRLAAATQMGARLGMTPGDILAINEDMIFPSIQDCRGLLVGPDATLIPITERLEGFLIEKGLQSNPVALDAMFQWGAVVLNDL